MIGKNDRLTIDALGSMGHREIILWGDDAEMPGFRGVKIRWIAFADGGMWRIRYGYTDRDSWWIILHGNVLGRPEDIRRLVPCDDEAFAQYRY